MTVQYSKKIREYYTKEFGKDLGDLYCALFQEVAWIYIKWLEYKELYYNPDKKNRRVELLNLAAKGFFGMLQRIMSDEITLGIARITDPAKTRGKDNLTIQKIPDLITDVSLKSATQKKVDDAVRNAEFARDIRNRHLAHRDLLLALDDAQAKSLEDATVDKIETALQKIIEVLETVSGAEIRLKNTARSHGAYYLLGILEYGVKGREEFLDNLKKGLCSIDDAPQKYR